MMYRDQPCVGRPARVAADTWLQAFMAVRKPVWQGTEQGFLVLSNADIRRYKENARDFLASPASRPFTKEAFAEQTMRMVAADCDIRLD
jgi:hypothetical protein